MKIIWCRYRKHHIQHTNWPNISSVVRRVYPEVEVMIWAHVQPVSIPFQSSAVTSSYQLIWSLANPNIVCRNCRSTFHVLWSCREYVSQVFNLVRELSKIYKQTLLSALWLTLEVMKLHLHGNREMRLLWLQRQTRVKHFLKNLCVIALSNLHWFRQIGSLYFIIIC